MWPSQDNLQVKPWSAVPPAEAALPAHGVWFQEGAYRFLGLLWVWWGLHRSGAASVQSSKKDEDKSLHPWELQCCARRTRMAPAALPAHRVSWRVKWGGGRKGVTGTVQPRGQHLVLPIKVPTGQNPLSSFGVQVWNVSQLEYQCY